MKVNFIFKPFADCWNHSFWTVGFIFKLFVACSNRSIQTVCAYPFKPFVARCRLVVCLACLVACLGCLCWFGVRERQIATSPSLQSTWLMNWRGAFYSLQLKDGLRAGNVCLPRQCTRKISADFLPVHHCWLVVCLRLLAYLLCCHEQFESSCWNSHPAVWMVIQKFERLSNGKKRSLTVQTDC